MPIGLVVGRGEHLDRSGHVQKLNVREGQHFDPPRRDWRDLWGLWRHRQTVPDYIGDVEFNSQAEELTDVHL